MNCSHHFLIEPEPEDPEVLFLSGTCKLCGEGKQWPRKTEQMAQEKTFRGYRRALGPDHKRGLAIPDER